MNRVEDEIVVFAWVQLVADECKKLAGVLKTVGVAVDELGDALEELDEGGGDLEGFLLGGAGAGLAVQAGH